MPGKHRKLPPDFDNQNPQNPYDIEPNQQFLVGGLDWSWAFVVFRDIPGFPGYLAGSNGTVWTSYHGQTWRKDPSRWKRRKQNLNTHGYFFVDLWNDGRSRIFTVHRIVLIAFRGPCPDGLEGCHNNGDRKDNRLENLRRDKHSNNQLDQRRHGTAGRCRGERQHAAKLTRDDIPEIRRLDRAGVPQHSIGKMFGIHQVTVSKIVLRKSWGHVPD